MHKLAMIQAIFLVTPFLQLVNPKKVSKRPVADANYTSLETLSDRPIEVAPTSVIYAPMYASEEQQKLKYPNRPDFTVADGRCFGCGKKVYLAERLVVLERLYHRNCFRCAACNNVLSVGRYSVHDDQPYCIPHHKQLMYLTNSSLRGPKGGVIRDELDGVFTESRVPIVQGEAKLSEESQPKVEPTTTSPASVYQNPLAMLTKSLRERDADHRLCSRCLLEIGLDDRILLSDRALHARCAECRVCHLNLNSFRVDSENNCFRRNVSNLPVASRRMQINIIEDGADERATRDSAGSSRSSEIVPDGQEQNPCYECHLPVHPRDGMNVIDRFYHYGCFKCTECQEVLK
ncbi:hypothetical protein FBUS_00088 [Fasciolopsis buskii]|uniref:LIM zinc-binding domain-containing protein n=1 Tax=Fasciolopsis buskii TaxID=27845 RepID=A0A8E0VFU5_9TREM|nr:hypothetical protein FBUS_00088 [Fasciolopsis buski]